MTTDRPINEQRKLAAFLAQALDASISLSDMRQLDDIPDEGIVWFTHELEIAMGIPAGEYKGRAEALLGINAMVHRFCDAGIPDHVGNNRHIVINSGLSYVEPYGDTGIYGRNRPDGAGGGASEFMSQRLLRFYRHLNGWKSISAVRSENGYRNDMRNYSEATIIPQMIESEVTRYKAMNKHSSDEEAKKHVQSNYICIMTFSGGRKHRSRSWCDLSPQAQIDYVGRLTEQEVLKADDYKKICARPGWKSLDRVIGNRAGGRGVWNLLAAHLEACATELTSNQKMATGCTQEEARQSTQDNYMWTCTVARGYVRRVLSPEAQEDAQAFLAAHKQAHGRKLPKKGDNTAFAIGRG